MFILLGYADRRDEEGSIVTEARGIEHQLLLLLLSSSYNKCLYFPLLFLPFEFTLN